MVSNRLLALAVIATFFATCAGSAGGLNSKSSDAGFLMNRHEVLLANGQRMNLICAGTGKPTVIVESGLGSHMLHWQKVALRLSTQTRTCFYDRAGFGFSDASLKALTTKSVTDDLHSLLRQAGISRPVVLVGHSLGGLYATVYANRFVKDVAGLVFIEPSFAQQDKGLSPAQRVQDEIAFKASVTKLRSCAVLARAGRLANETHEDCFAFASNRTPAEKDFLSYQFTRPYRYEAMASEIEAQHSTDGVSDINSKFEIDTRRKFGKMPLVVLTAEMAQNPNDSPADRELALRSWASWKAGHNQLASRSTIGTSIVVANTGHFIQIDQPDAVVEAVGKVVAYIRRSSHGSKRR